MRGTDGAILPLAYRVPQRTNDASHPDSAAGLRKRRRGPAARRLSRHSDELVQRFGGLTAFIQSPPEGLWKESGDRTDRDDIVMLELMADTIERTWWTSYRERLQALLRQESIVIRVLPMEML